MDQLITARDDLEEMLRYANLRRAIEALGAPMELRLTGLDDLQGQDLVSRAMQIPALLIVANDEWRMNLRSDLARWEALDSVLLVIPQEHHRRLLQNQLSDKARIELHPRVEAWIKQHPHQAGPLNTGGN